MPSGIGNIRRIDLKSSLRAMKDTANFKVEKAGRFSARFVQICLSFFLCFFVNRITIMPILSGITSMMWFLLVVGMVMSAFNVAMYMTPWISKKWTSKRIVIIETFVDSIFFSLWVVAFIMTAIVITPVCRPGVAVYLDGCTASNWVVAMSFFLVLSWGVSLYLDILSLYQGLYKKDDVDPQILLEIHRSARSNRV